VANTSGQRRGRAQRGAWCPGCSRASEKRLKEARATIATTFGEATKELPLCPECWRRLSDGQVAALFTKQYGSPAGPPDR